VWLLDLATVRHCPPEPDHALAYDDATQMTLLEVDGRSVPAVTVRGGAPTKKADIEKGEDQKDRWRP
jgi:hypothetical protein